MTTDARVVAAEWRPQHPGRRAASDILDPIIEPDWAGLRVVAAIDEGQAEVYRYGDRIDVPASLEAALADAFAASAGVIEGHLTRKAFDDGIGVDPNVREPVPRGMFSLGRLFRRNSKDPYLIGRKHQADEEARALPYVEALAGGEEHAFVATDLLWLDGRSLLDFPLLERKRHLEGVLAQSRLIRVTPFVRPGGSRLAATWGRQGFEYIFWRAANSRYRPDAENPDWTVVPAPSHVARPPVPNGAPGGSPPRS
jgi:hypothetical protein